MTILEGIHRAAAGDAKAPCPYTMVVPLVWESLGRRPVPGPSSWWPYFPAGHSFAQCPTAGGESDCGRLSIDDVWRTG